MRFSPLLFMIFHPITIGVFIFLLRRARAGIIRIFLQSLVLGETLPVLRSKGGLQLTNLCKPLVQVLSRLSTTQTIPS